MDEGLSAYKPQELPLAFVGTVFSHEGVDGSSEGSQQCPKDEAELRYTAQRGKVPSTLQQTDQKISLWGSKE